MTGRILMATVASLALAMPAMAQDQAIPPNTEQGAKPPAEQTQGAAEGAMTEQAPTVAAPTMAEDQPAGQATGEQMAAEEEAAPPKQMAFLTEQDEAQILASDEVIGAEVRNVSDETVGEIADLVLDQDRKLTGVVLSVGGFLGIGDKWVAVPPDQIELPRDGQPARLQVAVTEEQLTNAPDFITKETIEAQKAAEQAQRQAMEQRIPPPATSTQ
jgi:hypothetical protein